MPTITTNIGRGSIRHSLTVTDARDVPAAYRAWMHEAKRQRRVCVEAIADFAGLVMRSECRRVAA